MHSFSCNEFHCPSLLNLDSATTDISRLLKRRNLEIVANSAQYSTMREILDDNKDLFKTNFASFAQQVMNSLATFKESRNSFLISSKLRNFLRLHFADVKEMLLQGTFKNVNYFLFLLTEFKGLKIKLFQNVNKVLSCEVFGKKNGRLINLYLNGTNIILIDSLKQNFQEDEIFLARPRSNVSKSQEFISDISNEEVHLNDWNINKLKPDEKETNFKACYTQLEGSTDKETTQEIESAKNDAKIIHQELFGHQIESSDDSFISIQSEDLFKIKKETKQNQTFCLQIHKTFSEFPASEQAPFDRLLTLSPSKQTPEDNLAAPNQNKKFLSKVIYEEKDFKCGKIKFYSDDNDFGFIIMENGEEIFVHKDDLVKASIDTQKLAYFKKFYDIQVKFRYIQYQGKMKVNRKAVDVQVVGYVPLCYL
jgi:hypothetical protein